MDILVQSSAELRDAFASANDGDVIKLAPGDYGSTLLRDRDFNTDVTITSADSGNRAVFDDSLEFNNVSGVTVEDIDIEASGIASSAWTSRLQVVRSEDVTLRDISLEGHIPTSSEESSGGRLDPHEGYGYENGMRLRWSENVTLEDIEFSNVRQALAIGDSNNTTISNVNVHDVREGINLNDANNTLIEDSWFHDFKPYQGDHPDMIQYWGTDSGVQGLTIRDNLLDQADGWTQSIFGHFNGRPDNVTGSDFVITGNTIINNHPNAIRIREIDGFEISDNRLLPNDPDYDYRRLPQITLLDSQNGEVSGNFLLPRWDGSVVNLSAEAQNASNIDVYDNVALSADPGSEFYWADLLDGDLPEAPSEEEEEAVEEDLVEEPLVDDEATAEDSAEEEDSEVDQSLEEGESLDGEGTDQVEEEDVSTVEDEDAPVEGGDVPDVEEPSEVVDPTPEELAEDDELDSDPVDAGGKTESEPEVAETDRADEQAPAGEAEIDISQIDVAGTSGSDWLLDTSGGTSLAGLEGSDRFLFDYTDAGSTHDVLTDLDFSEGDQLILVGGEGETLDNGGTDLAALEENARLHIGSEDDLREAAENGSISLWTSHHGDSLIVTLGEAPDRSIELLGISPDDFLV